MINISVTADDAGTDFRTELYPGPGLAPDDGSEMRLIDADDTVGAAADVLLEHHLLLFIHPESCLQAPAVMPAEAPKKVTRLCTEEILKFAANPFARTNLIVTRA